MLHDEKGTNPYFLAQIRFSEVLINLGQITMKEYGSNSCKSNGSPDAPISVANRTSQLPRNLATYDDGVRISVAWSPDQVLHDEKGTNPYLPAVP